jgi:RNA polymerase sigma factor (sigma-70 family)
VRRQPRSWDRLVRLHGSRLTAVARRSLSRCGLSTRTEDVEDLVQDVWCRLVERWGTRPGRGVRGGDGGLFAYLATVIHNAAVDRARAAAAAKRGQRCPRDQGRVDLVAAAEPTPEERLLERDGRRLFRARCRPYTSRARRRRDVAVAELALIDGWTSRQIADALRHRLAPSSVDSLVHRVRSGLAAEGVALPSRR